MRVPISAEFTLGPKGEVTNQVLKFVEVELTDERFNNFCKAARIDIRLEAQEESV